MIVFPKSTSQAFRLARAYRRPTKYYAGASQAVGLFRSLATLAEKTRSDATFAIPVVDFSKFLDSTADISARKSTAKEVVDAFKEVGF
ncbi:hypothetical protein FRC02_009586, partial [Tulasnella sp. 418]